MRSQSNKNFFLSPNTCIFLLNLACVNAFVKENSFWLVKNANITHLTRENQQVCYVRRIGKHRLYFTDADTGVDSKIIADTCRCRLIRTSLLSASFNIGDMLVQKRPKMTEHASLSGYTQSQNCHIMKTFFEN